MFKSKWLNLGLAVLVLAGVIAGLFLPRPLDPALPLSGGYQTPVHFANGSTQLVVEDGGELEMQSGATLDIQSGVTVGFDVDLVADTGTFTTSMTAADGYITDDLDVDDNIAANDVYVTATLGAGGAASLFGGVDVNGTTFTIDADADTTLAAGTDDQALLTLGAATGYLQITTGNLKVGNGTPGTTLNGEDAYIEGTLEVDNKVRLDGALDANSTANVASTATLNGLVVTTTSDLKGNVSDSGGAFTIADNTMIDGAADAVQLTVQGYATQTSNLVVFENSAGTDLLYLTGAGVLQQVGAATVGGKLTVNDAADISGDADEIQLTVTGHTTQTSNLVVFEAKGGGDLFTLTGAGVGAITGAFTVGGKLTVNDAADVSGDADEIQFTVSAYLTQTSNLVAFEDYTGTDYLTVSGAGAVDVTSASITFGTDNLYALGYASDARAVVCGSANITGTKTIASGADTYEYCTCSMGEAPDAAAGQGFISWCTVSAGDVILYTYTVTGTQSTETNVAVNYCIVSDTQP